MNRLAKVSCVAVCLASLCVSGCEKHSSSESFHRGRESMMKAQFDAAETALLEFERSNSNHEFSSRARFLRAKARLGAGDLERAASLFQETIDQFPGSEEADKARFKLALISLLQNDVPAAKQRFQQIVDRSDSVYVPEAIAMLAMLKRQANE